MIFSIVLLVLQIVALVFLLLANVTLPVTTALKLSSTGSYTFGIFGYCKGSLCLKALYPVAVGAIDSSAGWLLAASTRTTLAKTFIVAPIAAGITFFAIVFTLISVFNDNTVITILSLVFSVLAFIATTLIAVMVVLVFHPNVAWTGWLLVGGAAALLITIPCLILAVRVHPQNDDDSQADDSSEKNLGPFGGMADHSASGFSGPTPAAVPRYQFAGPQSTIGDTSSSFSKDYSYRGTAKAPAGYTAARQASNSSLYDSNPRLINDVTKPTTSGQSSNSFYEDAGVNINDGPSTPISAKQQMAPTYVPNVAQTANTNYKAPYPQSVRGSAFNPTNYGVFDHHPDVEGHQPFTELGDNDLPERTSLLRGQHELDSDDDSDFTSVSQRAPNVMYNAPVPPRPQGAYQQQYPNVSQYQPPFQQVPGSVPNQFQGQGQPALAFQGQPQYGQPQYQVPPQQYLVPPAQRPVRGPTVSDNALSTNPDFAIGFNSKRKQYGVPQGARYGAAPRQSPQRPRAGSREGPYGAL